MADAELEELQQQQGPRGGPSHESGQEEQRKDPGTRKPAPSRDVIRESLTQYTPSLAERRATIMNQILDPAAADRLGRIRLVKESRAVDIENRLMMLAQTGQLRQKVTEDQLKELLNAVAENQRKEEEEHKIVISRRKGGWDDDDDLLDL
ncbi:DNA-binding protein [Penicillium macrosclerotiorum]|uniref:DNA-binding protein n=1 Tax=Penicillium macrosclerotiorum TaxID=303699 RepID=UPI002549A726|nr:DNA-binding protein [Penicillium macrosclerotiorum]KAJ5692186.1 DNA-binding protein [Penicillium macrosclerotiorum]